MLKATVHFPSSPAEVQVGNKILSTRDSCAFWNLLGGVGVGVHIHCFLGNKSGMHLPLDTLKAEKNTIHVR